MNHVYPHRLNIRLCNLSLLYIVPHVYLYSKNYALELIHRKVILVKCIYLKFSALGVLLCLRNILNLLMIN